MGGCDQQEYDTGCVFTVGNQVKCGTQVAEDKSRMAGGSKLARRMAYKKKLEEEYRMAAEKIQVKGVKRNHGFTCKLPDIMELPSYEVIRSKRMSKFEEEDEEESNRKNRIIDETNRLNAIVEENIRKDRLKEENSRQKNERLRAHEVEYGKEEKKMLRDIEEGNKVKEIEKSSDVQKEENEMKERKSLIPIEVENKSCER